MLGNILIISGNDVDVLEYVPRTRITNLASIALLKSLNELCVVVVAASAAAGAAYTHHNSHWLINI